MLVASHDGRFHADEVFAIATFKLLHPNIKIIRSRDKKKIKNADILIDVGHKYNPDKLLFDHHQTEGAGKRENGVPYASFGLIWKAFGKQLSASQRIADYIDLKIVQLVDAEDNGIDPLISVIPGMISFTLSDVIDTFVPRHIENIVRLNEGFYNALKFASTLLEKEILLAKDLYQISPPFIKRVVENATDRSILVFDKFDKSWMQMISIQEKEAKFVIFPTHRGTWGIRCVPSENKKYKCRKLLPSTWAGLEEELSEVTNINGALFCHRNLFFAEALTKEAAIELAKIAKSYNGDKKENCK